VLAEAVRTPEMMEPLVVMDVVMGAEAVPAMAGLGTMEGMGGLQAEEAVPEATLVQSRIITADWADLVRSEFIVGR
jgi:hypothetical protein